MTHRVRGKRTFAWLIACSRTRVMPNMDRKTAARSPGRGRGLEGAPRAATAPRRGRARRVRRARRREGGLDLLHDRIGISISPSKITPSRGERARSRPGRRRPGRLSPSTTISAPRPKLAEDSEAELRPADEPPPPCARATSRSECGRGAEGDPGAWAPSVRPRFFVDGFNLKGAG